MKLVSSDKGKKPNHTNRTTKYYANRKKYNRQGYNSKKDGEEGSNLKQELLLIRASVSFIIVVVAFAIAKVDTPNTNTIQEKLKIAISENVTFNEAKEYGEKSIEVLYTFKENGTDKIDALFGSDSDFEDGEEPIN